MNRWRPEKKGTKEHGQMSQGHDLLLLRALALSQAVADLDTMLMTLSEVSWQNKRLWNIVRKEMLEDRGAVSIESENGRHSRREISQWLAEDDMEGKADEGSG